MSTHVQPALFTTTKGSQQRRRPSADEWRQTVALPRNPAGLSRGRRDVPTPVTTRTNLGNRKLGGRQQTQKAPYGVLCFRETSGRGRATDTGGRLVTAGHTEPQGDRGREEPGSSQAAPQWAAQAAPEAAWGQWVLR